MLREMFFLFLFLPELYPKGKYNFAIVHSSKLFFNPNLRDKEFCCEYISAKSWGFLNPDIKLNFLENENIARNEFFLVTNFVLQSARRLKVYEFRFVYFNHVSPWN